MEDENAAKYAQILYRLRRIRNKINNLNGELENMKSNVKNNANINNKSICEDQGNNALSTSNSVLSTVSNVLIPSIANKAN